MAQKKVEIENRSTVPIHGLKPGGKVLVEIDRNGTIINKLYRRRVADHDECIVLTEDAQKVVSALKKKVGGAKASDKEKKGGGN